MPGVFLDEATARQDSTGCMKFVSGVLDDEAFHEIPDDATHRQDARSWCLAWSSMWPPLGRIRQDA